MNLNNKKIQKIKLGDRFLINFFFAFKKDYKLIFSDINL